MGHGHEFNYSNDRRSGGWHIQFQTLQHLRLSRPMARIDTCMSNCCDQMSAVAGTIEPKRLPRLRRDDQ